MSKRPKFFWIAVGIVLVVVGLGYYALVHNWLPITNPL